MAATVGDGGADRLMARPDDYKSVLDAFRLGWSVAELRGRLRPNAPNEIAGVRPSKNGYWLPLAFERTADEQVKQAQLVVQAVAVRLDVDPVHVPAHDGQPAVTYGDEVHALAQELVTGLTGSWESFAKVLYEWDGEIQDRLAGGSSSIASAYQLGRGLSETFWALDPHAPEGDASSWTELFRPDRVTVISRLLGRFSPYCQLVSAPAVAGSLKIWAAVAADRVWREESDAHARLRASVRRWFSLLVLDQDPETMVKPYAWLKNYRTTGKIVRMFAPQLIAMLIGVGLLTAAGALVGSGSGGATVQAVLGALGVLGLSAATLQAGAKSAAQSLLTRIRQDTYIDLIAAEISSAPQVPKQQRLLPAKQATEHRVRRELCRRELTGSLPDGR